MLIQKDQLQIVYPLHLRRVHLNVLRLAGCQDMRLGINYGNYMKRIACGKGQVKSQAERTDAEQQAKKSFHNLK